MDRSEDCVPATAFDAVDKYNLDTIIISDGVATATPGHFPALKVMKAALATVVSTDEFLAYMNKRGTVIPPKPAALTVEPEPRAASPLPSLSSVSSGTVSIPAALALAVLSASLAVVVSTKLHHLRAGEMKQPADGQALV